MSAFGNRPHFYGTVRTTEGEPLSFGIMSFKNTLDMESTKVLDVYGRYLAIFPAKTATHHITIKERAGGEEAHTLLERDITVHGDLLSGDFKL